MMTRILGLTAFTGIVIFGGLASNAAAPPAPPASPPPGTIANPGDDVSNLPHPLRVKQLLGAKISIQNNTGIGTVDDIVISDAGDVDYVVVKNSDNKYVSVPWSTIAWNKGYTTGTVNIAPEKFKTVPTYDATNYPDYFTPTYRNSLYQFYGATPGQLRRLNRRLIP
jgi:hypothetical protein